ncbi:peptidase S24/S26A/S26B/S26C [Lanmaoa asiatica]|nr:peptidase S24/S26A/S26B/S26C [Lanmaoa asiatica]
MIHPWFLTHAAQLKLLKNLAIGCIHAVNIACFLHLFKENIGSPCLTDGPSMLPTFETSGEIAIESIVSHRLAPYNLARGELVSLKSPVKPNRIICKRIIGLPGDVVCVDPTGSKAPSVEHVISSKRSHLDSGG